MDNNAAVCVKCGYSRGNGNQFCPNCGSQTAPGADFCTNCGFAINQGAAQQVPYGVEQKSKLTAGLLGIFLGGLGIHNFYLGFTGKAIAQICLSFCFGIGAIWGLIEGIMILTGSINKDAKGIPLKD